MTKLMLSFSPVGIEEALKDWGEERAEWSDSLNVTPSEISMRRASVSHSLSACLWNDCATTRADLYRESSLFISFW